MARPLVRHDSSFDSHMVETPSRTQGAAAEDVPARFVTGLEGFGRHSGQTTIGRASPTAAFREQPGRRRQYPTLYGGRFGLLPKSGLPLFVITTVARTVFQRKHKKNTPIRKRIINGVFDMGRGGEIPKVRLLPRPAADETCRKRSGRRTGRNGCLPARAGYRRSRKPIPGTR